MYWTQHPPKTLVKAMRFQGEHSPIQPLNIKVLCSRTTFCPQTIFCGRLCEVQEAEIGKVQLRISAIPGWKIPLLSRGTPISHLHLQCQEAADEFFVNCFPCCICSVFLIILTWLFSLPVLSCLFLICAV